MWSYQFWDFIARKKNLKRNFAEHDKLALKSVDIYSN